MYFVSLPHSATLPFSLTSTRYMCLNKWVVRARACVRVCVLCVNQRITSSTTTIIRFNGIFSHRKISKSSCPLNILFNFFVFVWFLWNYFSFCRAIFSVPSLSLLSLIDIRMKCKIFCFGPKWQSESIVFFFFNFILRRYFVKSKTVKPKHCQTKILVGKKRNKKQRKHRKESSGQNNIQIHYWCSSIHASFFICVSIVDMDAMQCGYDASTSIDTRRCSGCE